MKILPRLFAFLLALAVPFTVQAQTSDSIITQLNAIAAEQAQLGVNIKALQASAATLVATNGTLTTANSSLTSANSDKAATITSLTAQNATLANQVASLQAQLASSGQITAALQKALDDLKAASKANADLLNGGTTTLPPPMDDSAIIAELTDNTPAGISKRLGPTAPAGMTLPDVWERPMAATTDTGFGKPYMGGFSQGLSISTTVTPKPGFDYGSTDHQVLAAPDDALVFTPNADDGNATINMGLGVYRLRTEEHSEGQVSEAPVVAWNGSLIDNDSLGHVRHGMKGKLGRPIASTRGKINRYDVGLVLYDESRGGTGYFGTVGTETAFAPWSGTALPAGKIPLSIALSSQNEFTLIGVYDRASGKGQILIYWNWAGNDLQQKEVGYGFPYDFPVAHPGLINSGVITGNKLFATVDLPIKYPTSIDCVNFAGSGTRIQGPDGNASYLNIWPLSTAAQRTAFLAQNSTWIPSWGKACVASRYENKAVTIDLTALFAGVRDQYFGSQTNYDQTAYTVPQTSTSGSGWDAYSYTDATKFPWGVQARPAWAPVVGTVINLPSAPNDMLLSERGDAEIAVACADGFLRFYKWSDGSADGGVRVGDNPVYISHDKPVGSTIRSGGPVVTCRASRSVVVLSGWGTTATVKTTIQDNAMVDPVAADVGDTHGLSYHFITVCDFNGKKVITYRDSDIKLNTQGGAVFKMGPDGTATIERGGVFALPAKPFALSDSNVN